LTIREGDVDHKEGGKEGKSLEDWGGVSGPAASMRGGEKKGRMNHCIQGGKKSLNGREGKRGKGRDSPSRGKSVYSTVEKRGTPNTAEDRDKKVRRTRRKEKTCRPAPKEKKTN